MILDLLPLVLLGGVLALDATSVGQFMFSRPLVSGALAGWVVGEPALGLRVGVILEMYLLVAFPTGGSRFPEGSVAAVVAVSCAATLSTEAGALPIAIAVGLAWGHVAGWSVTGLRRLNSRFVPEPGDERVSARQVTIGHLWAVVMDFVRGSVVTFLGLVAGSAVVNGLGPAWPVRLSDSLGLVLVGAAVSAGVLLRSLGGFRRRKVLFAIGLAVGVLGPRFL